MTEQRDDGAVAVLVALLATVLFVFGAFAVDLGAAYAERRVDQTSADAAALGGANALPDLGGSPEDAVRDARAFVEANLAEPSGGWSAAWEGCTDPQHLAFTSEGSGECISVSEYGTRVRVLIPTRQVPTTLAAVVGISSIAVSARAEAQIEYAFGADVIPFALTSGTNGPELCVRAGTTRTEPCSGPSDGNFGTLNFTHFGNAALGTLLQCDGDMGNSGRLSRNIALGIDHALSTHPGPVVANASSTGDRTDEDMCEAGGDHGSRPNATQTQAGLRAQVLLESFLTQFQYLGRTIEGRFRQIPSDWPSAWPTVSLRGYAQDNKGLWEFMPQPDEPGYADFLAAVPPECDSEVVGSHALMVACLEAHAASPSSPALFTRDENGDGVADILASPRFAWVPQLWEPELTSGTSGPYHFQAFRPVFLDSLRFCGGGPAGGSCASWYAGEAVPAGASRPDELAALLLADGTLPDSVLESGPFTQGTPTVVLHR